MARDLFYMTVLNYAVTRSLKGYNLFFSSKNYVNTVVLLRILFIVFLDKFIFDNDNKERYCVVCQPAETLLLFYKTQENGAIVFF